MLNKLSLFERYHQKKMKEKKIETRYERIDK